MTSYDKIIDNRADIQKALNIINGIKKHIKNDMYGRGTEQLLRLASKEIKHLDFGEFGSSRNLSKLIDQAKKQSEYNRILKAYINKITETLLDMLEEVETKEKQLKPKTHLRITKEYKCPACKKEIQTTVNYCPWCGVKIQEPGA